LLLLQFQLLLLFRLLPMGFRDQEWRVRPTRLRGQDPASCALGQMKYQLQQLCPIELLPKPTTFSRSAYMQRYWKKTDCQR